MLTHFDDYLVHQTIDTLDHVASGDPRFQDRGLFNVHAKGGDFYWQTGFGVYPNQNMIDGWICAVHGGQQYNMRFARPLLNDRSNLSIGPVHIEVINPMSQWRLWTERAEFGVSCDLTFHSRAEAFEFRPVFLRRNNRVEHHQMHFLQSGHYDGWLEIGGRRFDSSLVGSRDRSWGVRGAYPNQALEHAAAARPSDGARSADLSHRAWIAAEFEDFAIHGWFVNDSRGQPEIADGAFINVTTGKVEAILRSWKRPVLRSDTTGKFPVVEMELVDEQGRSHHLTARPLAARHPEGNGYFKGFYGRQWPSLHVEGELWNLVEKYVQPMAGFPSMLAEYQYEGKVGYGAFNSALIKQFDWISQVR